MPSRCVLCGFQFGDTRVTGADLTPYAQAYSVGERGWRLMAEWVWFARWERLTHLALMRASAASRRFAWRNLLLLTLGLGVFQATRFGWRWVSSSPAAEPTHALTPAGRYWIHVADAPRPLPVAHPPEVPVDLWWNPLQSVVAVAIAMTVGLLMLWLVVLLIRTGATWAHRPPYRGEQRMTAAIQYGTAWAIPIFVATLVIGLRPLSFIGGMEAWPWYPPERGFTLSAAVVAGFGATLWWFWLVRLGATAPAKTRSRVIAFFALGAPALAVGAGAGWWYGLNTLYEWLFEALRVNF